MAEILSNILQSFFDFSNVMNISIMASWLILVVLLFRFILKKAPKWIHVSLWGIVALRLVMPFSIESVFSLIPSTETISAELLQAEAVEGQQQAYLEIVSNPAYGNDVSVKLDKNISSFQWDIMLMTMPWMIGMAFMAAYAVISYLRIYRKVYRAVLYKDNIFQSENISSPFVLGMIKPKIYLPFKLDGETFENVVAHEKAHICRKDHWWKIIGFILLIIHWFNPFMWMAYILLCRDIELACDEKVIRELDHEQRAEYAQALVVCSINRRAIAICPLAFGEVGIKERVKAVMNYKKSTFLTIVLAVCVCMIVAVCFLTDPSDNQLHAPEPFCHTYRVEEILYSAPQYSFSYSTETAPSYCFTADYAMFVSADVLNPTTTEEWIQQNGSFEEVKITTENFDDYFKTYNNVSGWNVNNDTWSKFRSSIDKSWRLCVENNEQNVFYYFILTKSGDVYLSYGYDVDNSNNIVEEDSLIRWLFKLTRTDMLEEYRTDYLGDAPNVSAIAQRLPYPGDYTYSSIELQTSAEPYELIIYLNGNEDVSSEDFKECADIAFDLIGNMDMITFIDAKTENRLASYD